MINPSDINLQSLPWLPLTEKAAFPKQAAIYFVIDSQGCVQYIGRSVNVRARWGRHHRYDQLDAIGDIKIAYLLVDTPNLLPQIEEALIDYFQPCLNGRNRNINKPSKNSGFILNLKKLRNSHPDKPSQRYMGDLLGMTESNYRKLESNNLESVKLSHLDILIKFFNCKLDDILEYIND